MIKAAVYILVLSHAAANATSVKVTIHAPDGTERSTKYPNDDKLHSVDVGSKNIACHAQLKSIDGVKFAELTCGPKLDKAVKVKKTLLFGTRALCSAELPSVFIVSDIEAEKTLVWHSYGIGVECVETP